MTKDEALRLALEALETCTTWNLTREQFDRNVTAITTLRTAIEQAEKQEPVAQAWAEGYRMGVADERTSEANIGIAGFNAKVEPARENPYINTPPQQETNDEPVAWIEHHKGGDNLVWDDPSGKRTPLYTTPPQRKPLTDEEIKKCWDSAGYTGIIPKGFARAIEAKLKEKST